MMNDDDELFIIHGGAERTEMGHCAPKKTRRSTPVRNIAKC